MTRGDAEDLHPVSYDEAERTYMATIEARERFEELTLRDLMVRSLAKLRARGEYNPQRHGAADDYQPLTRAECLEILALGTVLARYYRHPAYVDHAVRAGASWTEVAAALGSSESQTRRDYRTWAESQHQVWATCAGEFGLNDVEYAAALARAAGNGSDG
jgi:hypothetical protein